MRDSSHLLPPDARRRWVALPRYRLYQALAFFLLLGVSIALWFVGIYLGIRWMTWTPPLTVIAFAFMNLFLKSRDKLDEEEVKRYGEESRQDPNPPLVHRT